MMKTHSFSTSDQWDISHRFFGSFQTIVTSFVNGDSLIYYLPLLMYESISEVFCSDPLEDPK